VCPHILLAVWRKSWQKKVSWLVFREGADQYERPTILNISSEFFSHSDIAINPAPFSTLCNYEAGIFYSFLLLVME
jgi:hypothetical protein